VALIACVRSGIGACIAKILGTKGVHLELVDRNLKRFNGVMDEIIASVGDARPFTADLRFSAHVNKIVNEVVSIFGYIDTLVNSAFWVPPTSIEKTTENL
jgi:NADP-dependent 3-hydroxy acid dehydrogenase YdfG